MRATAFAAAFAFATSALAQNTMCSGDVCQRIMPDGTMVEMNAEETAAIKRRNARTALQQVECRYADDPKACAERLAALFAHFPL